MDKEIQEFKMICPGDRVRIVFTAEPYLERTHYQHRLSWGIKMRNCIGKVGIVRSVCNDKIKIAFLTLSSPKDFDDDSSVHELTYTWHLDIVRSAKNIHFGKNDGVIIIRNADLNQQKKVYIVSENDDGSYCMRTTDGETMTWDQANNPRDTILPVYVGNQMTRLVGEEENFDLLQYLEDLSNRPNDESTTADPFIMKKAIDTWAETRDDRMFFEVVSRYPSLINSIAGGKTPLQRAVENNHWSACGMLLALGADCNVVDDEGNGLLHLAAKSGSRAVTEGLLTCSIETARARNYKGETVLHCALFGGFVKCIEKLMDVPEIDINEQDFDGNTVLHNLATMRYSRFQLAVLRRMLSRPYIETSLLNRDGFTPLHLAIKNNKCEVIEEMIASKPYLINGDGMSLPPLHLAAGYGCASVLHMLLQKNCMVRKVTNTNRTALHFAVEKWENRAEQDLQRMACIQELVSFGIPINACDFAGVTALHLAIASFPIDMVVSQDILNSLIFPNHFETRLEEIASSVKPNWPFAVACFLVIQGANLYIRDSYGQSPIGLIKHAHLRNFVRSISSKGRKPYIPLSAANARRFDSREITLCAFNCEENKPDITFKPCGHKVLCTQCAKETRMRRCPICYQLITAAENFAGQKIEMGTLSTVTDKIQNENYSLQPGLVKKIQNDALKAKDEMVRELQEKLDQLEMEVNCAICLERRCTLVFQCGHAVCGECGDSSRLISCHICRQPIKFRTTLYS